MIYATIPHVDYPHEPGRLYDCPRCEAECFCAPGNTQCVFCAILEEEERKDQLIRLSICQCCLLRAANDEKCGEDDCPSCKGYDRLENAGYYLSSSFVESCTDECSTQQCGHGEGHFSWSSCDWCDAGLGGDRYDVWAWLREVPSTGV